MNGIKLYSVNSRRFPLRNQDQIQENGIPDSYVIWIVSHSKLKLCNYSMDHPNLSHLHLFRYSLRIFKITGVGFPVFATLFLISRSICRVWCVYVQLYQPCDNNKTLFPIQNPLDFPPNHSESLTNDESSSCMTFNVYFILVLFSWLNGILLCAVLSKNISLILAYLGSHPSLEL